MLLFARREGGRLEVTSLATFDIHTPLLDRYESCELIVFRACRQMPPSIRTHHSVNADGRAAWRERVRVVRRCERDWHRLTGKASERGRESVNGSQTLLPSL